MKISIRRTGGFAGLTQELGSADAPAGSPLARTLARLKSHRPPEHIGADLFRYEISIEHGGSRELLVFQDNDPPDAPDLRDLIRFVQS